MVRIYSRGQNQPSTPPENLRNLAGIFGPPEEQRHKAIDQIEELVAALGAARAFSNNPDAKKLLNKIEHKLLNITFILKNKVNPEDNLAQQAINTRDVQGLNNCISFFSIELPLSLKQIVPGGNKAGSIMRLASVFATRTAQTISELSTSDSTFLVIHQFFQLLTSLLQTLERVEYKIANIEEEYWN
jgi:cob(I)alamin adenosyltransferase